MTGREPHSLTIGDRRWTPLDCSYGGHTGVFAITRVVVAGNILWACPECLPAAREREADASSPDQP